MSEMPDFDSMTPEEMMKWMESLAVRQGATEGLTTDADMEVAEVAEDDERLAGKGDYVPYGWTEEKWKERLAKEEAEKQAKGKAQPAAQAPAPTPEPEPEIAAAPPAPEPVAAQAAPAADGGMPDFDSMTPEEMMKWMESLAVRQGATEGLTTSADMQVSEVSADDERLAGKGEYVPYGWTEEKWKERLAKEEAEKQAKGQAQPAAQAPSPTPEPELEEEPDFEDEEVAFEMPDFGTIEETTPLEAVGENPMDWLSSLGAPDEDLPNLELNLDALGNLAGTEINANAGDPMAWLAGLSEDSNDDALASLSALGDSSDEGSLEWMESLAAEQGALEEELVTAADLDIPFPPNLDETGPGYEEFSFEHGTGIQTDDTPKAEKVAAGSVLDELEDPENWLDSLASGNNIIGGDDEEDEIYEEAYEAAIAEEAEVLGYDMIADDVKSKLDKGIASPEEIEQFFMHAFDKANTRRDVPDYIDSEDDDVADEDVPMPVQAEIPDWLRESMETNTVEEGEQEAEEVAPAKTSTAEMMIQQLGLEEEAPLEAELPEWLTEGVGEDTGSISVDIFAQVAEEEAKTAAFALETDDSWVAAFAQEESGELAEWYESAVAELDGESAPAASVASPVASGAAASLQAADLPEESLPHGNPMNLPEWLSGQAAPVMESSFEAEAVDVNDMSWLTTDESEAVEADMPDWLRDNVDEDAVTAEDELPEWLQGEDLDIAPEEIPDWLRETVEDDEEISVIPEPVQAKPTPPAPVPTPPAPKPMTMPVPVAKSPAPVPVAVSNIDVAATLGEAKSKISQGDIEGGLMAYEQVVRANSSLDVVESALQKMADDKNYKGNPAVHRVLGDTLMRQGKLQQALDTYRKALNML